MSGGFGHGKVILLGEHAVVYGRAALVAGIKRGISIDADEGDGGLRSGQLRLKDAQGRLLGHRGDNTDFGRVLAAIETAFVGPKLDAVLVVRSTLPRGVGLGSSAAFCVALTRVIAALHSLTLSATEVIDIANEGEAIFHSNPSGVDVTAAALGGVLRFQRGHPLSTTAATPLTLTIIVVDEPPPTRTMVDGLRTRRLRDKQKIEARFDQIAALVASARPALVTGDHNRLGTLFNQNHALLCELGVSSESLNRVRLSTLDAGAFGCKLTGGGGGGCLIAVGPPELPSRLRAGLPSDVQILETTIGVDETRNGPDQSAPK